MWIAKPFAAGALVCLVACGGGGGGGSGPQPFTVGGTVSGLASGDSVVLVDNGGDSTTVTSNTTFTFPVALVPGLQYAVTVGTQPVGQTCTVAAGSGVMGYANITNVAVVCTTNGYGNSLPPSSGPGDVENFFPNGVGNSWSYLTTSVISMTAGSSQTGAFLDSVSVTGSKTVNGTAASVFLESNPSGSGTPIEAYYLKNNGGVAFLGTNDASDTVTKALVPYLVALFPLAPGTVAQFNKNGVDYGSDLDGDGINETVNLTLSSSIVGFEPLAIGIGQFTRTVRSNETITGSILLSKTHTSVPLSATTERWSAPGIGVLKSVRTETLQSTTTTQTEEARGYTVNGVAHGFGPPFTLASGLPGNIAPVGDRPALATDGNHFLAASEDANGLVATLLDVNGARLATARLAAGPGSAFELAAFDGTNYWVVYAPYSTVTSGSVTTCYAQRLSAAGTLLDANAINLVSVGAGFASIGYTGIAFGNTNGLLAFSEYNSTTNQHELHGVLLKPDGTTAGGAFAIATDNSTHLYPAVAFDGTNFLVTWQQLATSGATVGSIHAVRVSPAGVVVDPAPILLANPAGGAFSPSVAFDGANYLVVWTGGSGSLTPGVYGARISRNGVLLDGTPDSGGIPINTSSTLTLDAPHVVYTGTEYLVVWQLLGYAQFGSLGVQAARVSTNGTLVSGANLAIAVSGPATIDSNYINGPALAAGPAYGAVIWYETLQNGPALRGASFYPP
jgi:hypothetical protein